MAKERIATVTLRVVVRQLTKAEMEENGDPADLMKLDGIRPEDVGDVFQIVEENPEAFAGTGMAVSVSQVTCTGAEWVKQ